ncbi:unnamed protein product [Darwinula stevensoni]|uniref:SAM domain-containing protein n=1 Tax=Darwinula stevensoni TaxID=69355 RepID=A0A7R8XFV4_9CRUS|nr:unnamed protein product [Darwinula stevensoni]CAG0891078.1 unnamed protein product [Darwinula stevensoni]
MTTVLTPPSHLYLPSDDPCGTSESACRDRQGFEAITALHRQLDDDDDGDVDIAESDEFLREELQYRGGSYERRQQAFHQNDKYISVLDLWESWMHSEVRNWTVEQTVEWLRSFVDLPMYSQHFIENAIDGMSLPILATNARFLSDVMRIKDPIHRQKIALKAMDVVLFGAPKDQQHFWKETILSVLLILALGGYYYAHRENVRAKTHLRKVLKDLESLSHAEETLKAMHAQLIQVPEIQDNDESQEEQRKALEKQIRKEIKAKLSLEGEGEESTLEEQVMRLQMELSVVRRELERAETELQDRCWFAPPQLQHWLQLTYEIELKYFNAKKCAAERQLTAAKDACEKLKKKRTNLVGAFVSTHGRSLDDVDHTIMQARTALVEVTYDLQERTNRWKQVEMLCGCPIMNNPGLPYLEALLRGFGSAHLYQDGVTKANGSQDEDDDNVSVYAPSAVGTGTGIGSNGLTRKTYPTRHRTKMLPSRDSGSSLNSEASCSMGQYSLPHSQTMPSLPYAQGVTQTHSKSSAALNRLKDKGRELSRESTASEGQVSLASNAKDYSCNNDEIKPNCPSKGADGCEPQIQKKRTTQMVKSFSQDVEPTTHNSQHGKSTENDVAMKANSDSALNHASTDSNLDRVEEDGGSDSTSISEDSVKKSGKSSKRGFLFLSKKNKVKT